MEPDNALKDASGSWLSDCVIKVPAVGEDPMATPFSETVRSNARQVAARGRAACMVLN